MARGDHCLPDPYGLRSLDPDRLRAKRTLKWQAYGVPYAAWVADMDFDIAPEIVEALQSMIDANEFGYPYWNTNSGLSSAGEAFVGRMSQRYGWEPDRERLYELNDVVQGVQTALHHCSEPGDGVVIHLPAYYPFLRTVEEMGRRLVPVLAEGREFDYDRLEAELERSGARVWILCHPHNPLGHVFDRAELERIAELAERFNLMVISDEIHAELMMPTVSPDGVPRRHLPFAMLSDEIAARTVTVTSAAKAFNLAGLGWAIMHAGTAELDRALKALPGHYRGFPNRVGVTAVTAAWTRAERWREAVIEVIDENRHGLVNLLDRYLPGAIYTPPEATYLAWVDCRPLGIGDEPAEVFLKRGVGVNRGADFGSPGEGHVRINLATSPAILADTIAHMAG